MPWDEVRLFLKFSRRIYWLGRVESIRDDKYAVVYIRCDKISDWRANVQYYNGKSDARKQRLQNK